jgi:single-strand DNA-binding protein
MTKLSGRIKRISETQNVSAKFQKREFVLEVQDGNYPQFIQLEFTQDNCDKLNDFKVGHSVDVDINIRGREWTSPSGEVKYFNTLQAWRISGGGTAVESPSVETVEATDSIDLPF